MLLYMTDEGVEEEDNTIFGVTYNEGIDVVKSDSAKHQESDDDEHSVHEILGSDGDVVAQEDKIRVHAFKLPADVRAYAAQTKNKFEDIMDDKVFVPNYENHLDIKFKGMKASNTGRYTFEDLQNMEVELKKDEGTGLSVEKKKIELARIDKLI